MSEYNNFLENVYSDEHTPDWIDDVDEVQRLMAEEGYHNFSIELEQQLDEQEAWKGSVLGMWASEAEGAKFWLSVVTELKNRGVADIFIACVDGLKGFPEAIEAVFPHTQVQLCLVHMVRHWLSYVASRDRKQVATDLKEIYQAATLEEAELKLEEFQQTWAQRYPLIGKSWKSNWARVMPMFGFPEEIRRAIYTTNTIESLNMTLRKIIKNRSLFPNDEAVYKLMYLALKNISKKWTMPIRNWSGAMNQFAIIYGDRVPMPGLG
jgi:putative transposase